MKTLQFILLSMLLLAACGKERPSLSSTTAILGHGGMGISSDYPLNSLESILQCLEMGADGTEIDVQMSRDGELFAYHDKLMEESTDGEGAVHILDASELEQLRFNNAKYGSFQVMKLLDMPKLLQEYTGKFYSLDCKKNSPDPSGEYAMQYATAIAEVHAEFEKYATAVVELSDIKTILALQQINPSIPIYYLGPAEDALDITGDLGLAGYIGAVTDVDQDLVAALREKDVAVSIFNANSRSRNRTAIELQPDFIQTDRLRDLLRFR